MHAQFNGKHNNFISNQSCSYLCKTVLVPPPFQKQVKICLKIEGRYHDLLISNRIT
ncbi:hypothetical protein SLEP1_g15171 [Rubroshorea leprosula]|uniref:Uncharacterized protein n=1 Tax=Rubroshorea leprosula TaxID=152421 RepID=A0AAV5ILI7_9ROSI|nr:hypothetical protein SLEP1_g15171 [Rubroshorea leprosula]